MTRRLRAFDFVSRRSVDVPRLDQHAIAAAELFEALPQGDESLGKHRLFLLPGDREQFEHLRGQPDHPPGPLLLVKLQHFMVRKSTRPRQEGSRLIVLAELSRDRDADLLQHVLRVFLIRKEREHVPTQLFVVGRHKVDK